MTIRFAIILSIVVVSLSATRLPVLGQEDSRGKTGVRFGKTAAKIQKLIAQMDSKKFRDRAKAQAELLQIGLAALPALRKAARLSKSAEVRESANRLVAKIRQRQLAEISKAARSGFAILEVARPNRFGAGRGPGTASTKIWLPAVCIHKSGLFIAPYTGLSTELMTARLTLHPGQKSQKVVKAKPLSRNQGANFTLLAVDDKINVAAVPLGDAKDLSELVEVVALSLPGDPEQSPENPPPASPANGHITSMLMRGGLLTGIQIETTKKGSQQIGCLLDKQGRLIGIGAETFFTQRGRRTRRPETIVFSSSVLPINLALSFLAEPVIRFEPPTISPAALHKPVEFTARVVQFKPAAKKLELHLVLIRGGVGRSVKFKNKGGIFRATAIPMPLAKQKSKVQLTLRYSGATVQSMVADRRVKLGKKEFWLSELRELHNGSGTTVKLANNQSFTCDAAKLNITTNIGGAKRSLNLAKAKSVNFHVPPVDSTLNYQIIAWANGKQVAQTNGVIRLSVGPRNR